MSSEKKNKKKIKKKNKKKHCLSILIPKAGIVVFGCSSHAQMPNEGLF